MDHRCLQLCVVVLISAAAIQTILLMQIRSALEKRNRQ